MNNFFIFLYNHEPTSEPTNILGLKVIIGLKSLICEIQDAKIHRILYYENKELSFLN